ncbi:hypothetical protein CIHG_02816 [Coccidioides immitis H538.4]|uniref:Uncharacterized protein n=3 Tax=Coccidioides immitis TaxID=5501 RepID=A0A0J8U0K7_COCIT|nr:hypothetical protein CIRG_07529 [Coccidioides immitis RMSCC 2394]KMU79787.1 hypothetical protein CISG_08067 [Coccidioides immitis RMSCC 3703]KMU85033.1 hypothetical protein CIHG_02816 [Coccidioides immitis H538.4]
MWLKTVPSLRYRSIMLSLFMVISLVGLSVIYVQFFRLWAICARPTHELTDTLKLFWRKPHHAARKHQRALWVTSVGSIGVFPLLFSSTIIACTKPYLWTQITTLQVAIISLRKVFISIYLAEHLMSSLSSRDAA